MAKVKSQLWNISKDPIPLSHVKISGKVEDLWGSFTIEQTYVTPKGFKPQDCIFQLHLCDIGLVTSFNAVVGGTRVDASCLLKSNPKISTASQSLIKGETNFSSSDTFICRVANAQPETTIKISLSVLQTLRLDGESLCFHLPCTLSPKTYFHHDTTASSLRAFSLDYNVVVKMTHGRAIQKIRSPTAGLTWNPTSPQEGKLIIQGEIDDQDIFTLIDLAAPIQDSLPHCIVSPDGNKELVMFTIRPHFKVPVVAVSLDEGHPDPREVLVTIDPHQSSFEEVSIVLHAILQEIDQQIYFNFILVSGENIIKMFPRSSEATSNKIQEAKAFVDGPEFTKQYTNAKSQSPKLPKALKTVLDIDCVSEDTPRVLFLLSKGHTSDPASLFDVFDNVLPEKNFSAFSFGLGRTSNYFVLKTISSTGATEMILANHNQDEAAYKAEAEQKIKTQIARICQPVFDTAGIDWGNLTKFMMEQTPCKDLPLNFWNSDLLTIIGVTENAQMKGNWNVEVKVHSKALSHQSWKVTINPKESYIKDKTAARVQMKIEREQPNINEHVRMKKIYELSAAIGVASARTVFYGLNEQHGVTLISSSDPLLDDEPVLKPVVKYDKNTLLRFQPHNTEKPIGWIPGEAERGITNVRTGQTNDKRFKGKKINHPAAPARAKKLQVRTQWTPNALDDFFRTINSLLNKMSGPNFPNVKAKLLAMKSQIEADVETLNVVVGLIFEKALVSPRFAPLYADLCVVLAQELKSHILMSGDREEAVDFRRLLLASCRDNFECSFMDVEREPENQDGVALTADEQSEKDFRKRERLGANITFIGELFLRNLLPSRILHIVIRALLKEDSQGELGQPDAHKIELVCKILTTLGPRLDEPDSVSHTNRYFAHLETLSNNTDYDMRSRFILKDLTELRTNLWVYRKGGAATATKPSPAKTPGSTPTQSPLASPTPARVQQQPASNPQSPTYRRANPPKEERFSDRGRRGKGQGLSRNSTPQMSSRVENRNEGWGTRGSNTPASQISSRVENRSDGWVQRGGNAIRKGSQQPMPQPKRPDVRGGPDFSTAKKQMGRGVVEKQGDPSFSFRGGRGGFGRGEAPKRDLTSNTYSILSKSIVESDSEGSAPSTPKKSPTPAPPKRSREEVTKLVTRLVSDYIKEDSLPDALESFQEVGAESTGAEFVSALIQKACEASIKQIEALSALFNHIAAQNCLTKKDFEEGALLAVAPLEDLRDDYPLTSAHLGRLIGDAIKAKLLVDSQLEAILAEFPPHFASQVVGFILKSIAGTPHHNVCHKPFGKPKQTPIRAH